MTKRLIQLTGDIFALDLPAIGQGVNVDGVMGGLAGVIARMHPNLEADYQLRCRRQELKLGDAYPFQPAVGAPFFYQCVTQERPGADARLDGISRSLPKALADADKRGLSCFGIPRIGAGIGGLEWDDVLPALRSVAYDSPIPLIVVTQPGQN